MTNFEQSPVVFPPVNRVHSEDALYIAWALAGQYGEDPEYAEFLSKARKICGERTLVTTNALQVSNFAKCPLDGSDPVGFSTSQEERGYNLAYYRGVEEAIHNPSSFSRPEVKTIRAVLRERAKTADAPEQIIIDEIVQDATLFINETAIDLVDDRLRHLSSVIVGSLAKARSLSLSR
jgi:hypothetical protein